MKDEARFQHGDEAVLVMASFACRVCLATPHLVIIRGTAGERFAASECPCCTTVGHVSMTDEQTFQLWTLPRGNTFVHFPPEDW